MDAVEESSHGVEESSHGWGFFFHDIPCAGPPMPLMKGVGLTAFKGTVGELKGTGHKGWTGSHCWRRGRMGCGLPHGYWIMGKTAQQPAAPGARTV